MASSSTQFDGASITAPVVFTARGLKADVKLEVFGTEFRVHSLILKLHSAFFFAFLDSPDKTAPVATSSNGFTYEWITMVDKDGSWSLVARDTKKIGESDAYPGNKDEQVSAFNKLLCAIYSQPFEYSTTAELVLVTELADYYRALPMVSIMLDGALLRKPLDFFNDPETGAQIGLKLRHRILLADCVCFLAGKWDDETDVSSLDPILQTVVKRARNRICAVLADAHKRILATLLLRDQSLQSIAAPKGAPATFALPEYYRRISEESNTFRSHASALLGSNLVLERGVDGAGKGKCKNYFLCAKVEDEDLPWQDGVVDW